MFNGLSYTFQKEWSRSHQQNERPRYHRLEQHRLNGQYLIDKMKQPKYRLLEQRTLNRQDLTEKINDLEITNWSNTH